MELLYLYIEKYRNFEKQEFCFTSEYTFDLKEEDNTYHLTIEENPAYIPNFFENESITNVTAVIGENGSGKSNLLDFIKYGFPEGFTGFKEKALVIYKDVSSEICLSHNLEKKFGFKSSAGALIDRSLEKTIKSDFNKGYHIIQDFHDFDYIYYSNNVDLKFTSTLQNIRPEGSEEQPNFSGYYNISTIGMLGNDSMDRLQIAEGTPDKLDLYKLAELNRNLNFIIKYSGVENNISLGFNLPNYIQIQIQQNNFSSLEGNKRFEYWLEQLMEIGSFAQRDDEDLFFNQLYANVITSLLYQVPEELRPETTVKEFKSGLSEVLEFRHFSEEFLKFLAGTKVISSSTRNSIKNTSRFIKRLESLIENKILKVTGLDSKVLILQDFSKNRQILLELYDLYLSSLLLTDYLSFQWRNLSSGEQSLLTLLSRFYSISDHNSNKNLKENVLVVIDEGDLYFHPEWQRKYLKIFLDNIPAILGQNRKYQFIFTANTPFLAADLPTDNIIFLEKKEEVNEEGEKVYTTQAVKKPNTKTFAANIHTLLADGFYLTSFLGEFAQQKIEHIAGQLTSEGPDQKISEEEQTQIWKTIQAIGEPIIYERLKQLYEEKFGLPREANLDQHIDKLEKEITRLKAIRNKGNDKGTV